MKTKPNAEWQPRGPRCTLQLEIQLPKKCGGGSRVLFYLEVERFPTITVSFIFAFTTEDKNVVKSDWRICTMSRLKAIRRD